MTPNIASSSLGEAICQRFPPASWIRPCLKSQERWLESTITRRCHVGFTSRRVGLGVRSLVCGFIPASRPWLAISGMYRLQTLTYVVLEKVPLTIVQLYYQLGHHQDNLAKDIELCLSILSAVNGSLGLGSLSR